MINYLAEGRTLLSSISPFVNNICWTMPEILQGNIIAYHKNNNSELNRGIEITCNSSILQSNHSIRIQQFKNFTNAKGKPDSMILVDTYMRFSYPTYKKLFKIIALQYAPNYYPIDYE